MMGADASLHADQARWQVGKSRLHLATRPFLPQHDCTTPIVPYDVERVLADIDADHRDCAIGLLRHGVLLVFAAPGSVSITGGAGARPDHPISGSHLLFEHLRRRWPVASSGPLRRAS